MMRMGTGFPDRSGTESLRRMKRLSAKNHGDLSSAVISAGHYARKLDRTMYVYSGNSFMRQVWRVSYNPSDFLNPVNNTGDRMLSVTPDLEVLWHEVIR